MVRVILLVRVLLVTAVWSCTGHLTVEIDEVIPRGFRRVKKETHRVRSRSSLCLYCIHTTLWLVCGSRKGCLEWVPGKWLLLFLVNVTIFVIVISIGITQTSLPQSCRVWNSGKGPGRPSNWPAFELSNCLICTFQFWFHFPMEKEASCNCSLQT